MGLEPISTQFRLDDALIQEEPYPYYPQLREHAPVLRTDLGGKPCWVMSRHEDITKALMDPETFSSRTTPMPTILHTDPPDQQRLRKMISGMFTRTTVSSMAPFIAQRSAALLDPLLEARAATSSTTSRAPSPSPSSRACWESPSTTWNDSGT